jgi:hypothetical protein
MEKGYSNATGRIASSLWQDLPTRIDEISI